MIQGFLASLDYILYVPLTKKDFRQYSQLITEWDYNFPSSCPQNKLPSSFVAVHSYSSIFNSFQRILPLFCFTMMVEQVNGMILSGPSGLSMLVHENKLNGNFFLWIPLTLNVSIHFDGLCKREVYLLDWKVVRKTLSASRHCSTVWLYIHLGWRLGAWEF